MPDTSTRFTWEHPTDSFWELRDEDGVVIAEIDNIAPGWYTYYIYATDLHGGAFTLGEAQEVCEAHK